jgi:hypothetical protein
MSKKKKRTKKTPKRKKKKPKPPEPDDYARATIAASKALELLAKKLGEFEAAEMCKSRPYTGLHRHREPTAEQIYALEAALDVAVSAAHLCAVMHPKGCPPQLQLVSEAIDMGLNGMGEALRYLRDRYVWKRPRAEPPRLKSTHGW